MTTRRIVTTRPTAPQATDSEPLPHFRLFVDYDHAGGSGRWQFVLRSDDGHDRLAAGDVEPGTEGDRLALLTLVRGLEALNCASQVTVVVGNRYVKEGIRAGLAQWKAADWCWERFGELVPIPHRDLWERLDRAMQFHRVACRTWRIDPAHARTPTAHIPGQNPGSTIHRAGSDVTTPNAMAQIGGTETVRRPAGRRWFAARRCQAGSGDSWLKRSSRHWLLRLTCWGRRWLEDWGVIHPRTPQPS